MCDSVCLYFFFLGGGDVSRSSYQCLSAWRKSIVCATTDNHRVPARSDKIISARNPIGCMYGEHLVPRRHMFSAATAKEKTKASTVGEGTLTHVSYVASLSIPNRLTSTTSAFLLLKEITFHTVLAVMMFWPGRPLKGITELPSLLSVTVT